MDIICKIIFLQAVLAVSVVFVLRHLLERELLSSVVEQVRRTRIEDLVVGIECVNIISARKLSGRDRIRIISAFNERCSRAQIVFLENADLKGGIVVEFGAVIWDYSFALLWQKMFRREGE